MRKLLLSSLAVAQRAIKVTDLPRHARRMLKRLFKRRDQAAHRNLPFNACVARPVGRKEMLSNPKAKAAMGAEWSKLIQKGVWRFATVRDL